MTRVAWMAAALVASTASAAGAEEDPFEADDQIIVVEDEAPREDAIEATVTGAEGARVAGVQGDAVKAIQTLGGVARTPTGSDGLVVWGASPSDTRLYVDDVPVPRLFHLGGTRSILPTPVVSNVRLVPGGAGARYGRAIGGAVSITTSTPGQTTTGGQGNLDPFDIGAGVHRRFGSSSWGAVSVRRGLLADSFDLVADDDARQLLPVPRFWDYQARARHTLDNGDELQWLGFGTVDRVERGIPSLTPDTAFTERARSQFHRAAVRLVRRDNNDLRVTKGITVWVGVDRDRLTQDFGDARVALVRRAIGSGIRLGQERPVNRYLTMRLGLDLEMWRTRTDRDGAISAPAREGDPDLFGQPPGDRVNRDVWTVSTAGVGAHATAVIRPSPTTTIEPGLRVEPSVLQGSRVLPVRPTEPAVGYSELQVGLDPRVRARYRPNQKLQLYAAAGRYHQQPEAGDLSPIFGSPVLDQAQSWQALVGAIVRPARSVTVEVTTFGALQRHLAVRAATPTPGLAAVLESTGRGRTIGAQLVARGRPAPGVSAALSYTLMRAQRRDQPGKAWRRFDGDQTHVAQALAGWRHRSGLELGARAEVASGLPRTPVVGAVFNTSSQTYDPMLGAYNSERLPTFAAISLRVGVTRRASWGRYAVWLDVQNLTNRNNAEEVFYSSDFSRRGFVHGLPVLPTIGARVQR